MKKNTASANQGNAIVKERLRKELEWAIGQFQAIRAYTDAGKVAAACAEAEERLKRSV